MKKRIINKWTYATLKKVVNEDDLVVTNDINDDTADIRVIASDEEFEKASNYNLLHYFPQV